MADEDKTAKACAVHAFVEISARDRPQASGLYKVIRSTYLQPASVRFADGNSTEG